MAFTLALISTLLHLVGIVLSVYVVRKYEHKLKCLCPTKSFNPLKYEAVRFWTILLSFVVCVGFFTHSLQFLVAKTIIFSLQYQLLGIAVAILNLNYLILMLLERRGM